MNLYYFTFARAIIIFGLVFKVELTLNDKQGFFALLLTVTYVLFDKEFFKEEFFFF
jgi:hypothetical protein